LIDDKHETFSNYIVLNRNLNNSSTFIIRNDKEIQVSHVETTTAIN